MPKVSKSVQVYHHMFRWSIEHNNDNKFKLMKWCRRTGDKFIFQAEDTTNNPHYQGYIHTVQKTRSKQLASHANDELKGIEVRPASTNGQDALRSYCMKDETRVAGPWADKRIYMGADLWSEEKFPDWQKTLLKILRKEPGDRKMQWIYDPVGNNGKTKFCKWLCYKMDAVGLSYGHSTDVLNLVSKFQGKYIYCWNLTRAKPANLSELDLYSAMESVKDGFFINLKYETAQVLMDCPHVVVFANHIPRFEHISKDRWDLYEIQNSKLVPIYGTDEPNEPNAL